jgi:glycosyltransferase involved in cell wall biosynthesis
LRAADLVLARSAHDLAALRQAVPQLRGQVLPPVAHAADCIHIPLTPESVARPGRVLFVGALDRARNQQAARWLAQAVWPRVRTAPAAQGAELRLVGANPPPAIRALGRQPGVTVTGWVPDLPAEYAQARVVAAPLRGAAGALNKVIDGLAAGRPVVATAAANAGVGAPPEALFSADRAADFADAIVRLLADDVLWRRTAEAARRFAASAFDWAGAAGRLEAALVEMVHERRE